MKSATLRSASLLVFSLLFACSEKPAKITNTGTSIILEGHYNGNNIFVKNPVGPDGLGFCVNEILINDNRTSDEISSETIEIDLKASGIHEGNEIKIEIRYYKGCEPTVLNPDVLK